MNVMTALPYQDRRQVIEAVAHVISASPVESLLGYLQSFCLPIVQRLQELSTMPMSDPVAKEATDLIDSFAVFLKYLVPSIPAGQSHPCVSILSETWPILKTLLSTYGRNQKLAEAGARLMRSSLSSYRLFLAPLAPEWADALCVFLEASGYGCWLWVATKFIKFNGSPEMETAPLVHALVERITMAVFQLFSTTSDIDTLDEGNFLQKRF